MRVYCYDKITKEFTGYEEAQENPNKKGEFLLPANSTFVQVNDFQDGYIPVFNNIDWDICKDYRGKTQINLENLKLSKIDYIGEIKPGFQLLDNNIVQDFIQHPECYAVVDNVFQSIIGTEKYAAYLENEFDKEFITTDMGAIRINTAWGNFLAIKPNYDNKVEKLGYLPADSIILYKKPQDFKIFKNKDELNSWLISQGKFLNSQINKEKYEKFSQQILERFHNDIKGGF